MRSIRLPRCCHGASSGDSATKWPRIPRVQDMIDDKEVWGRDRRSQRLVVTDRQSDVRPFFLTPVVGSTRSMNGTLPRR